MRSLVQLTILCALLARFYGPVTHYFTVLGAFRAPNHAVRLATTPSFVKIEDTVQCEDMHYYPPTRKIFTACEDSFASRFQWFPALGHFDGPGDSVGSLHVIDPQNFEGPFVTHGIDVIEDPDRSGAVYIFAVNHLRNPEYDETGTNAQDVFKARSQIELFHHILGTSTATHVRSVRHPLITTPNDIYAKSPSSFYATNDHFYRHGLKRHIEDAYPWAKWTNVVHVRLDQLKSAASPEAGINATVALSGIKNSNGIGHGQDGEEILLCNAIGGIMYRARADGETSSISILDEIRFDSTIDNPSYFADPYRTVSDDASGYVQAGLLKAMNLSQSHGDPSAKDGVTVWYTRRKAAADGVMSAEWETRQIFEDDGSNIHTASSALLVPVESPKKARLFVTGFSSESVVAVDVDL
ncbi:hypothetical protein EYZ11_009118 [Aspergillus tanneri]|uniref:Serum paraoxonase/arylesterase 2 n=1 Tax=Aspergillus tanneri TaxID=1220188 RepID=A0A4S3JAV7_9EURO|nr:uncharacterized protein ATNIH1004_006908 [Aspergillus tanneri]KAA8645489.1 hypothetical protein ATNIH1004_006908 [Aspergillus tanneri]THC91427.1 hypothetical protein EYZ11_009118 [Aspergillus tanneri]